MAFDIKFQSKIPSPVLRDPSIVHSDLKISFLTYFDPEKYTLKPK